LTLAHFHPRACRPEARRSALGVRRDELPVAQVEGVFESPGWSCPSHMTLREQGSTSGHGIQIMAKSVTESKEVLTFIHEARRFCRYVSRIEKRSIGVTSQDLLQILLSLCHRALQLPDIERSPLVDHPFRFSISKRRRRRLARYFGKYDV
jgi:hypothetical protein